jgi:hypothetical protein
MGTFVVTSNDTLTLNGHVFIDQPFGDVTKITFPNALINMKTGKNGNSVLAGNASGFNADLELKVLRGSPDDQFMQGLVITPQGNFPATELLAGTFSKQLGDGKGNFKFDVYNLAGGFVSKVPDGKENVDGDTEQGTVSYMVKFANAGRAIQ